MKVRRVSFCVRPPSFLDPRCSTLRRTRRRPPRAPPRLPARRPARAMLAPLTAALTPTRTPREFAARQWCKCGPLRSSSPPLLSPRVSTPLSSRGFNLLLGLKQGYRPDHSKKCPTTTTSLTMADALALMRIPTLVASKRLAAPMSRYRTDCAQPRHVARAMLQYRPTHTTSTYHLAQAHPSDFTALGVPP